MISELKQDAQQKYEALVALEKFCETWGKREVTNQRTDAIYEWFCEGFPDAAPFMSQRQFSTYLCAEYGLKVTQAYILGKRCYIYECR